LGDGMFFIIILVFFIFRSYFYLLLTIVSILIQTIFVQGLKRFIFPDLVRPKLFFDDFFDLHKVEGIDIHAQHAFPSGHTATAFTIALIFSLYVKNKNWSFVFILAALFVGLSRIYLLQHFLVDIYFGSLIGIISVILSDYLIGKSNYLRQRLS
jgi:membrane-associated phospholipid phosphatase